MRKATGSPKLYVYKYFKILTSDKRKEDKWWNGQVSSGEDQVLRTGGGNPVTDVFPISQNPREGSTFVEPPMDIIKPK